MQKPNIDDSRNWEMIWNDEFSGPALNESKWRTEQIMPDFQGNRAQMSQHVTNTFGFDNDGNLAPGKSPDGKRHALWYNKYLDKTLSVENGSLVMGAYKSDDDDPTIKSSHHPYKHPRDGKTADFTKKIYTSWIDTYAMSWHDGAVRPARQESPNFYFRYGFVEVGVNFEQMHTDGLRNSAWLLPAVDPDVDEDVSVVGKTYDDSAANGLECDIFEYENSPGSEHMLLCKNIGANAVKIPAVDCRKFGIDITKGDHTIAVYWSDSATVWYVDGIEVARDEQAVVHISMALYLTREGNSGVNSGDGAKSDAPYLQNDPGLWGYNIGTQSAEEINSDKALIRYIRVWQDPAQKGNWIAPAWRDNEGVEAEGDVVVPTKPSVIEAAKSVVADKVAVTEKTNDDFGLSIAGNVMTWNKTHDKNTYDIKFGDISRYKTSVRENKFVIPDDYEEGTYFVTSTPANKKFVNSGGVVFSRTAAKVEPVDEAPVKVEAPVVAPVVEVEVPAEETAGTVITKIEKLLKTLSKLTGKK